jgi:hypothetical protein
MMQSVTSFQSSCEELINDLETTDPENSTGEN